MKKIIFSTLILFITSVCAFAGSDIKVTQGDKKFFKTASGTAIIEFVWEGATYDNKMPLEEKFSNLEHLKKIAWNGFQEDFNDKCKTVKITKDSSSANYKFTMQVKNMDQYYRVMGFVPGFATKVWGTLTISNNKTGEVLVVIDVDEVDGGANPSPDETFSDCFEELAQQVAKLR